MFFLTGVIVWCLALNTLSTFVFASWDGFFFFPGLSLDEPRLSGMAVCRVRGLGVGGMENEKWSDVCVRLRSLLLFLFFSGLFVIISFPFFFSLLYLHLLYDIP